MCHIFCSDCHQITHEDMLTTNAVRAAGCTPPEALTEPIELLLLLTFGWQQFVHDIDHTAGQQCVHPVVRMMAHKSCSCGVQLFRGQGDPLKILDQL